MGDAQKIVETLKEIKIQNISMGNVATALVLAIICLIVIKIVLSILDKFLKKSFIEKSLHSFIRTSVLKNCSASLLTKESRTML